MIFLHAAFLIAMCVCAHIGYLEIELCPIKKSKLLVEVY